MYQSWLENKGLKAISTMEGSHVPIARITAQRAWIMTSVIPQGRLEVVNTNSNLELLEGWICLPHAVFPLLIAAPRLWKALMKMGAWLKEDWVPESPHWGEPPCITYASPEKQSHRVYILREREKGGDMKVLAHVAMRKLRSPMICHLQAGDLGKPVV